MFISDNNGFDWQFINWYFHHFTGSNPFDDAMGNAEALLYMMQAMELRTPKPRLSAVAEPPQGG